MRETEFVIDSFPATSFIVAISTNEKTMETNSAASLEGQFLNLLITQLQNQNPLEPVDQQEFLGQLAQFSTLEGIEKMNANFEQMLQFSELSQGSELLGKEAILDVLDEDSVAKRGTIEAIRVNSDGDVRLRINNEEYSLDQVQELRNAA